MSVGTVVRAALGPRFFPAAGRLYRRFFVNLENVVDALPPLPVGGQVLEVGAGHGELTNVLLARHPTITVTMQELSTSVGYCLDKAHRSRVRLLAATPLSAPQVRDRHYDIVLVTDVMHHVPRSEREAFMRSLADVIRGHSTAVFFKDLEPGHFRATLSLMADRYITGDRNVALISQSELEQLARRSLPGIEIHRTPLYEVDAPSYAFIARS